MKLSKKITLNFVFAILFSILIVSIVSNIMINSRFENYLVEEQDSRLKQISFEINDLYSENNNTLYQRDLDSYASLEDITIKVQDLDGNLLYNSTGGNHMGGMGGMHRRMMRMHNLPEGNYVEKNYPLLEGDKQVASLILGYIDNSYLTESALIFKNTLRKSFLISTFFTLLIGFATSILLSRSLTTPLLEIRDTAVAMREGNLGRKSKVKENTVEILELSDAINYLGESLASQESIRRKYATDISHELRTPLATLKSHLEAIMDKIWEPNEEHLQILMEEIDRLSALVDDLKDSFRGEEQDLVLNKSSFNLSQELEAIVTTFLPLYAKKGYSIYSDIEDNLHIYMDQDKFKQIIFNLFSNSIKHLNSNGKVYISLKQYKDNYTIKLIDNGRGIPQEDLPFIFDRFFRSKDSIDGGIDGTGLGLSIVKSMIEAHKGSIVINSQYGEGTEIIITLPSPI